MKTEDYLALDFTDIPTMPADTLAEQAEKLLTSAGYRAGQSLGGTAPAEPDAPAGTGERLPLNRRDFLAWLGTGIVVFISLGDLVEGQEARRQRGGTPADFNAFLRIGEDGRVTCFTGKIEMGQGPITSLPQMLAEELEVPLQSVDIIIDRKSVV